MTMPFNQKRILITRPEPQASAFAEQITQYGGQAIVTPLIKINCQCEANQTYIDRVQDYEWLIFTSANGVTCFFENLKRHRGDHLIKDAHFAVVGPKTNQALQAFGYQADFIPSVYNAQTMAPEFLNKYHPTGPVLLVQGQLSGSILEAGLRRAQVPYACLSVYETVINVDVKSYFQHMLTTNMFDFITFMSPSTIDAFKDLAGGLDDQIQSTIICIGTTTKQRALAYGFQNVLVPETFTIEGMMEKMSKHVFKEGGDGHYGK